MSAAADPIARRLGLSYFFLFSSIAVVAPHLQVLLRALGYGPATVGALLGLYEVAAILGALPAGRIADASRRTGLVIQVCLTVAVASLTLLTRFGAGRTGVAVACVVATGFCFKNSIPLTDALSARGLKDSRQYGRVRVFGSIGYITASFLVQLGGWIRADDPNTVLTASAIVCGLYAAVLFLLPRAPAPQLVASAGPERPPRSGAALTTVLTRPFLAFLGVAFLILLGTAAHYSFFSLFLTQRFHLTTIAGVWALGSAAEIPMIFFSGFFLERFGIRKLLVAAAAAVCLRYALYAAAQSLGLVLAAQALHLLTFGAFHTASVAAVRALVPPRHQGLGMALYNGLCSGVALLGGSVLGGLILERASAGGGDGFRTLYLVFALPPALAVVLALVSLRRVLPAKPSTP